ncbi:MAG: transposase [Elusimicrobia bacterium]|nr:transposase [Elusimicrobiota bacterium]
MVTIRKDTLANDEIYHIFNKSISRYIVFNSDVEYGRFVHTFRFCNLIAPNDNERFSRFIKKNINGNLENFSERTLVTIIAYCIMPTHFHFIVKQVSDNGIAKFISKIANSYSKYFNFRHNRSGPLWQGRFKNVLIKTDEQLLHLTRYIHLNPVTAYIVNKPEEWKFSSYNEYMNSAKDKICEFSDILEIKPALYKEFVEDNISYQRELTKIKKIILE